MNQQQIMIEEIKKWKKEKNAIILAHNYQIPEIQDIGDFLGDSLDLSRKAAATDAEMIIFCGVSFMAETAKILAPEKKVLLPAEHAGCPMADMIEPHDVVQLKQQHPGAPVVCYVNSSAEVKAVSDICCTSANALSIANSLDAKKIIFIPDEGLGSYVAENCSKEVIIFPGYCATHYMIKKEEVEKARIAHPNMPVMVHPECRKEVRDASDIVAGTGKMIALVKDHPSNEFIVGTEEGMIYRLKTLYPKKKFHLLSSKLYCINMKKTTLEHIHTAFLLNQHEIVMPELLMEKARGAIEKMLMVG